MQVYARTRERERAWKLGAIALGGALFAAPFVTLINKKPHGTGFNEVRGWIVPSRVVSVLLGLAEGWRYRSCGHSPSFWNRSACCRSWFCYDKLPFPPSLIPSIFWPSARTGVFIFWIGSSGQLRNTKLMLWLRYSESFRRRSTSTLLGSIIQDNESSYATAVLWTRTTSAEVGCSVGSSAIAPKVLAKRMEPLMTRSHRPPREQVAEAKANGELGAYQFLQMMTRMVPGVQRRELRMAEMRSHHLPISATYPTTNWTNLWPMILFYQSVERMSQAKAESEGLKESGFLWYCLLCLGGWQWFCLEPRWESFTYCFTRFVGRVRFWSL